MKKYDFSIKSLFSMKTLLHGAQLFILFYLVTKPPTGFGQESPNADRGENASSLLAKYDPWLFPGSGTRAPSTPGDSEIGEQNILSSSDGYKKFNFTLGQSLNWTDNAALSEFDELSDTFANTSLRLNYQPKIGGNSFGLLSAGYSFFRYADHSELDFDSLQATLGLSHVFTIYNDLTTWVRYNHTRILSAHDRSELFTNHSIEVGAYYPIQIASNQSAYTAYFSEFSIDATPNRSQRNDHSLTLGYAISATDNIKVDTYYRASYQDYRERAREDLLQTLSVSASTQLTKHIDLMASASYSLNDSNHAGSDYEAGNIGALLGLKIKF